MTAEQMALVRAGTTSSERKVIAQGVFGRLWEENHCKGTFEGCTGVGKTRAAIIKVAELFAREPDALVYIAVPTETLRDTTWPAEFTLWGYEHLIEKIRFICWVSLDKEKPDRDIDLFVGDEFHHATVTNCSIFDRVKVWRILCLTATVPTKERNEAKAELMNRLAPSLFKITLEEGIALELVAEFEVKVIYHDLDNKDMYITVPNKGKGTSHTTEASRYLQLTKALQRFAWTKNEGAKFKFIQMRTALLRNLRSKTRIAVEILKAIAKDNKRTLVFAGSIDQCNELCGTNVYHSKSDDSALIKFQEKSLNYLGAVDALNEGTNINDLDQLFIVQGNSVDRVLIQRAGRSVRWRPNHKALIVVLVTKGTADAKWFEMASAGFNKSRIEKYHTSWNPDGTLKFVKL